MQVFPIVAVISMTIASLVHAQRQLGETTIEFATLNQGREVLGSRDDFVERLSPFDRAARTKSPSEASEAEYLAFVSDNVLEWEPAERETIMAAFDGVREKLAAMKLPLPPSVLLVKTTGKEEGNAAYTRANAIVFPQEKLAGTPEQLQRTLCHETFHVLSRANPELREKLYATIGFEKCDEVQLPPALRARQITNPDAPRNDHSIRVKVHGESRWVVPVLIATTREYDPDRGGEFFDYLELKFVLLDEQKKFDPVACELVDRRELGEFFEQIGRNTSYIIHPEEVLADNFALLMLEQEKLPSPDVVERMEKVLSESRDRK